MSRVDSGRARLVYVLGQFPSLSETFILREMVALEEMGFSILPLSMQPAPSGTPHAQAEPFLRRTLYRPRPLSGATLRGLLATLFQRPLGLASSLWFLFRMMVAHPGCTRELLSAYAAALHFASRLRPRDLRHVHAQFASFPATAGLMLMEICGCGFSISCHAQDIFGTGSVLLARKFREADFVTVCTRYGMERLQRNHSLILADKLHLVRHGVDVGRMAQETPIPYSPPMILSVGRLVEKKGFPFLLQAAAILHGRGVDFELVIAGEGPMRDELQRLSGGLGLRDQVVFTGHLTQEQLSHVYRRASVFCLASTVAKDGDRKGVPNVILEAMAYGVPVVASNLSAIPEAVEDGQTGLLVQPGAPQELAAQIEEMLGDARLRDTVVANARRLVAEEFDLMKNTVRLGGLFAQNLGLRDWPLPEAQAEPAAARVEL